MPRNAGSSADHPAATRRRFLQAGLAALPVMGAMDGAAADVPAFELDELTIADLQHGMQTGRWKAQALVERYLERIDAIDRHGPALHAVIEVNPDAREIAAGLDRERKEKRPRGPLHGIPVVIKDNIDTADRMATTAGSLALVGAQPGADAFLVKKLRQAGMVLLGKTNLSEWANIRCTYSTSGWSGRGGLTKNAYALDRNTSGSSSGSGVAVAASLCAVAVGTETDGSIVSPSSVNGIVGIKPTVGLVSRTGVIPIAHTQDTAGPMARSVRDAALLLTALAGVDAEDGATAASARKAAPDYTRYLDPRALRGARIGVARNFFGFHDRVDAALKESLDALKHGGAILIDPADVPNVDKLSEPEALVLSYELKADLNAYLQRLKPGAQVRSLADVIAFNERHRAQEMPYFGQNQFHKAQARGSLKSKEYLHALARCRRFSRAEGIDAVMDKHRLDALVAPTEGPACLTDLVDGDRFLSNSSTAAAVAGYPSITVPAGFVFGLPIGLSFFGRAWSEPKLIALAHAFEQITKIRRRPHFRVTADLHL